MQSRFAIVLMSIAGAGLLFCVGLLFGLGVMTAPKGGQHKEIAVTNAPVKVARRETTGSAASHDLTPLTPVHPGTSAPVETAQAPQPQAAPAQPAPASAAQSAPQPAPPAPTAQASAQPAPPPPAQAAAAAPQKPVEPATKEAKATPAAAPAPEPAKPAAAEKPAAPNATPVALHAKNSCDVQACSRAYKSFRESDCTYQPYSGPRQLCVSPPASTKEASRGDDRSAPVRVRRGDRDIEVQNVPREGARMTDGVSSRDEDGPVLRRQFRRDVTADGEDDGIDDSRVIVRRSADDRGGWHRSFFAPVEDDDDDQ